MEDLRASLDGKEAEIADLKQAIGELTTGQAADAAVWFRSHMEREIAVLKARGKKIDLAKNDELDKLRLALEATVMEVAWQCHCVIGGLYSACLGEGSDAGKHRQARRGAHRPSDTV